MPIPYTNQWIYIPENLKVGFSLNCFRIAWDRLNLCELYGSV